MHIVAITGTNVKGCTHQMMTLFLEGLREGNTVDEFVLPRDGPPYCLGCKTCFLRGEEHCPHADTVLPIWNAMLGADLIVLAYPVYALRAPAQVKALLDHLCVHWFVHRPKPAMFSKRAVIIAQAIGAFYRAALRDVSTSLSWLGVSDIRKLGVGLMEDIYWDKLSQKRRDMITGKIRRLSARIRAEKTPSMSFAVWQKFTMCKLLHRKTSKGPEPLSADNRYWKELFLS
jgi:NAD(P)H-dependent FMN reductase